MRAASMHKWVSGRPRWRSRWVRSPPSNTRSGWKAFETGCTRASFLGVACTSFAGDASLDDRRAAIDSGVPLIDFPQHPGHHRRLAQHSRLAFRLDRRGWRFGAALLSGVLQYFATGLEPWWWAAWLAPIPLLVAAFRASTREAWALAVIAGLIGSASTASFYAMVIGPIGSAFVMMLRGLVS